MTIRTLKRYTLLFPSSLSQKTKTVIDETTKYITQQLNKMTLLKSALIMMLTVTTSCAVGNLRGRELQFTMDEIFDHSLQGLCGSIGNPPCDEHDVSSLLQQELFSLATEMIGHAKLTMASISANPMVPYASREQEKVAKIPVPTW